MAEQVEAHVAVDYRNLSGKPANATVTLNVDDRRMAQLLVRTLTA